MNFTRADFASREHNARNIRVRFYDVRTAACHKYRRVASLQIASVCASFYYVAHFHVSLIGFMTPEIYWVLKNQKRKARRLLLSKWTFLCKNSKRFNFFIPGEYARIKIFTAVYMFSDYIFFFYVPFALYFIFCSFEITINHTLM